MVTINKTTLMIIGTLMTVVLLLGIGLAYKCGHNIGYDEGWNDGTAYAESWGWQGCIEENNLYNRYNTIKMEETK